MAREKGEGMRVIGLAGWSGAGKTTLLCKIIPELTRRGLRVSTLKHAHHSFDVDTPGKDSYEHRLAGAYEVLISSSERFALMRELRGEPEPLLEALLSRLAPADLVIVEGFKRAAIPKIEVHRTANGKPFLHPGDPTIVALVSDSEPLPRHLPGAGLDNISEISDIALKFAFVADDIQGVHAAAQ